MSINNLKAYKRMIESDTAIAEAIQKLHVKVGSVQNEIHIILAAINQRWVDTGDYRPALAQVNALLDDMPSGVRSNAIRAWVEKFMGFQYATEGENKNSFVRGKETKQTSEKLKELINVRWYEFTKEPTYTPMDFERAIISLVKRAEQDVKKLGEKSTVDDRKLASIKSLVPAKVA